MALTPKQDFYTFLAMIGVVSVPATLSLLSVERAQSRVEPVAGSSPLGYTVSLSLFIVPILVILAWLHANHDEKFIRKSFWVAIAVLVPLGFLLDLFFGLTFFTFVNSQATLEIYVPGFDFATWSWERKIPVEEFAFYLTGFVAVLLMYVWCDEYWLSAYNVPDYAKESEGMARILMFHGKSVVAGLGLIVLGLLVKNLFPSPYQGGFPGYFTFLVVASFIPSAALFKTTFRFINWRAVSLCFFFILLISLLWEATLASPYQWWGYNYAQMLGIVIDAWTLLPVEAVLVWMAVTFTTVIVYEAIKIWLNSRKSAKKAFLGLD